jgi:RNA polymerase sporulation-specific sigma factor
VHSELDILLDNVKSGKPLSFEAIYSLYSPLIDSMTKNYCKRYGIVESDTDDVRQEALIALYNAALTYEASKEVTFGAYAKICIRNKILSYIRCFLENDIPVSLTERENDWDEPDFDTPEQLIISKESLCHLNHRIDETLTDFEKSVFDLYIGNMSYTDIANILAKPKKSIDNAIHRIKAKLRKLI